MYTGQPHISCKTDKREIQDQIQIWARNSPNKNSPQAEGNPAVKGARPRTEIEDVQSSKNPPKADNPKVLDYKSFT